MLMQEEKIKNDPDKTNFKNFKNIIYAQMQFFLYLYNYDSF